MVKINKYIYHLNDGLGRRRNGLICSTPTNHKKWDTPKKLLHKAKKEKKTVYSDMCVYPFSREGGINLFGDRWGSIISNRAQISQEG